MKLLRQLDIGEYDNSADPAENVQPESNIPEVIRNTNGTPESQIISPQSYNNYVPQEWSPQQQSAYAAQNKPVSDKLNPEDYYPTLHHNINVGNYSGSEIGSTTLFAPAGRIVPLGIRDARDAAVHKQVLQKLKEQDDFDKKYNSPTTKHVAVQEELSHNYQEGLHQWVDNAKKKYGQNWAQELPRDRDFNAWNKSNQDLAKYHDQIANHMAELDMAEKDPNFVLSPDLRKIHSDMKSGIYSLSTGGINTRKTRDIESDYLASKGQYDLEKLANDVVPKMQKEITEEPLTNKSVSGYVNGHAVTNQKTEEGISPERLDAVAHNEYMAKYQGTNISEQQVKDAFKNVAAHKTTYQSTAIAPPPERQHKEDDYNNIPVQSGGVFNTGYKNAKGEQVEGKNFYAESVYNAGANDTKKTLSFAQSNKHMDFSSGKLSEKIGNIEGNVQGVSTIPYDIKTGKTYSMEDVNSGALKGNPNVRYKTKVVVNTIPKKDSEGNIIGGSSEVYGVDPDAAVGRVSKGFDTQIEKANQKAKLLNQQQESLHKPTVTEAEAAVTPSVMYSIKGKDYSLSELKKLGYTEDQVISYKKK